MSDIPSSNGFLWLMVAEAGCALLPFAALLVGVGVVIGWLVWGGK